MSDTSKITFEPLLCRCGKRATFITVGGQRDAYCCAKKSCKKKTLEHLDALYQIAHGSGGYSKFP